MMTSGNTPHGGSVRKHLMGYLGFAAVLTAVPLIPAYLLSPVTSAGADVTLVEFTEGTEESEFSTTEQPIVENSPVVYHVLSTATGEVLEVPLREYVIGAVGAEMPVSFEPEALKAQAVAAHTYAERQCLLSEASEELNGADFSDDPAKYQAFLTNEQLRERWGTNYEAYYEKLSAAVDAVLPELLTYENTPIIAAFHAMSSGRTEASENVWGSEVAYLRSVESAADRNAPQFEESVAFTAEEVYSRLTQAHAGLVIGGDAAGWFGMPVVSEAGTVLQQPVGDGIFTGQELRSIFGLRSAALSISYAEGMFTFTTYGYGHDVGMSQYGANAMALEGHTYREILAYYYPGTDLTSA